MTMNAVVGGFARHRVRILILVSLALTLAAFFYSHTIPSSISSVISVPATRPEFSTGKIPQSNTNDIPDPNDKEISEPNSEKIPEPDSVETPDSEPKTKPSPPHRFPSPKKKPTVPKENFPRAAAAKSPDDLPSIARFYKAQGNTKTFTPLFIGFTRNWNMLQQCLVSYLAAGWPADMIYIVDNSGTMDSNKLNLLTPANPFYINQERLEKIFKVNVLTTPTLFTFSQLQNFFLYTAIEKQWAHYFWSHMDTLILADEDADQFVPFYQHIVESVQNVPKKWALIFFHYDRLALVNTATYKLLGGWDPQIAYYGSDCDFNARVQMSGYALTDYYAGHILDVRTLLPDLEILYRQEKETCPETATATTRYKEGDCRFQALKAIVLEMDKLKSDSVGIRNTWQTQQRGGQGEPFYRDPRGFEIALKRTSDLGSSLYDLKWGHHGCNLAEERSVKPMDAWRVYPDWEDPPPADAQDPELAEWR